MGGFGPNSFDIAPRHADVIWGISNTFATIPGVVGVFVTGWLVDRTGSYSAPFAVTAGVARTHNHDPREPARRPAAKVDLNSSKD